LLLLLLLLLLLRCHYSLLPHLSLLVQGSLLWVETRRDWW
jgi:hypothetical protein